MVNMQETTRQVVKQRCPRCDEYKPEAEYHPDKWTRPGHYCKPCVLEYKQAWRRARGIKPKGPIIGCKYRPPKQQRTPSTTYRAVHRRVAKTYGPATTHTCIHCGRQAEQWAYQRNDTNPLTTQWYGRVVKYSADLGNYKPMCRPCHARFDAS